MRALTDEELSLFFTKLKKYLGNNLKHLVEDRTAEDEEKVFRMIKNRVYLISTSMLKQSSAFAKEKLLHSGVCFGQFTKTGKFRLAITCLGVLAQFSSYKVWLKNSGEQNYLYGNHVLKAHIARVSENTSKYSGVIVMNLNNVPLGFGVLAKAVEELKTTEPTAIFVFNQSDLGEYLRIESVSESN